jgi:hypothetical protein
VFVAPMSAQATNVVQQSSTLAHSRLMGTQHDEF